MTTKRRKTGREDIIGPGIDEERDEKIREEEEGGGRKSSRGFFYPET